MPGLFVLYGGTFDPVHHGHLAIARAARDALGTAIRLMPAADPPHRPPPGAAASDRMAMLELALRGEDGLLADPRELRRDERSWTVDTLRDLRREVGAAVPVALLLGADSFSGLPTWKDWRALFGYAHFIVASRTGSELEAGALDAALSDEISGRVVTDARSLRQAPAGRVLYLRQPLHPESATAIRKAIAAGEAWRERVPPAVADYIDHHRLYRDGDDGINGNADGPRV